MVRRIKPSEVRQAQRLSQLDRGEGLRTGAVARSGELVLTYTTAEGRRALSLAGELDTRSASALADAIRRICAEGADELVLDLHRLSFVDSSGLRALLSAHAACRQRGCALRLTDAGALVERLFEVNGVAGLLQSLTWEQ